MCGDLALTYAGTIEGKRRMSRTRKIHLTADPI